jgi:hypothetical protein
MCALPMGFQEELLHQFGSCNTTRLNITNITTLIYSTGVLSDLFTFLHAVAKNTISEHEMA